MPKTVFSLILLCINAILMFSYDIAIYEKKSKCIIKIDLLGNVSTKIPLSLEVPLQDFYLSNNILVVADHMGKIKWKNLDKNAWNTINKNPLKYKEEEKWGIERFKDLILINKNFILFVYGPEYERVRSSKNSFSKKRVWDKIKEYRSYYDLTNIGVYSINGKKLLNPKKLGYVYVQLPFLIGRQLIFQKYDDILVIDLDSKHYFYLSRIVEPLIGSKLNILGLLGIEKNKIIFGSIFNSTDILHSIYSFDLKNQKANLIKEIGINNKIKYYEIYDIDVKNNTLLLLKNSNEIKIFNFQNESIKSVYKASSRIIKTHFLK